MRFCQYNCHEVPSVYLPCDPFSIDYQLCHAICQPNPLSQPPKHPIFNWPDHLHPTLLSQHFFSDQYTDWSALSPSYPTSAPALQPQCLMLSTTHVSPSRLKPLDSRDWQPTVPNRNFLILCMLRGLHLMATPPPPPYNSLLLSISQPACPSLSLLHPVCM